MDTARIARPNPRVTMQTTMLVVIGTETAFFATLVVSYLFMRGGGSTLLFRPPSRVDVAIAAANTLVLLASALLARAASRAVQNGRTRLLKIGLLGAFSLGLLFVAGQIFEFRHSGMSLHALDFGGVFFALVGFHALHVLAGMVILGLNLARAQAGDFTPRRHVAVTAGTWFWYFVTAVWLVLFTVLYLI